MFLNNKIHSYYNNYLMQEQHSATFLQMHALQMHLHQQGEEARGYRNENKIRLAHAEL